MSGALGQHLSDVDNVARIEQQLVCGISIASAAVAHMDCFDEDQRSEIYTILQAMRHDTAAHCKTIGQWVSDRKGPSGEPQALVIGHYEPHPAPPSATSVPEGNGYA